MGASRIDFREQILSPLAPQTAVARIACIGVATKGFANVRTPLLSERQFTNTFGKPKDNTYGPRAALRYLKQGNQLDYVRVAGTRLRTASLVAPNDAGEAILQFLASSPGSWANDTVGVSIFHAATPNEYNVFIKQGVNTVAEYLNVNNSTIESRINGVDQFVTVTVQPGVGADRPAETLTSFGTPTSLLMGGGADGDFASTDAEDSTTGGIAGKEFYGATSTATGTRTWETLEDVPANVGGTAYYRFSLGFPVLPGTLLIRNTTSLGVTVISDSEDGAGLTGASAAVGVGLLEGTGAAVSGSIDYTTGQVVLKLVGGTFIAGNPVEFIAIEAETELLGATTEGQDEYAGNLSGFPVAPGWFANSRANIYLPVNEVVQQAAVAGSVHANDDNATGRTLGGWVKPGSVALTLDPDGANITIYDDGAGAWRDAADGAGNPIGTGSIDYRTGRWSVDLTTMAVPPAALAGGEVIQAVYRTLINNMGGSVPSEEGVQVAGEQIQDGTLGGIPATIDDTDTGSTKIIGPIKPGTLRMDVTLAAFGAVSIYDDGVGGWSWFPRGQADAGTLFNDAAGTYTIAGTIDYASGAWSVTVGGTAADTFDGTAQIFAQYTKETATDELRALRGPANGLFGVDEIPGAARFSNVLPAAGNEFLGDSYLNQLSGQFAFRYLVGTDANGFENEVQEGANIEVVYARATILGRGDGVETEFTGRVAGAPFRREAKRLYAFQGDSNEVFGSGNAQFASVAVGASVGDDFWENNVAGGAAANPIVFSTGVTTINWTAAPLLDEAVFILAEDVVAHVDCRWIGPIGNERTTGLTDGFYASFDADPDIDGNIRLRVFFDDGTGSAVQEAFSAENLARLAEQVETQSTLVTLRITGLSGSEPDTDATQDLGLNGAFTNADVIGVVAGTVATGLQVFRDPNVADFDFVFAPGIWHRPVYDAIQTLLGVRGRRAQGYITLPNLPDPQDEKDFVNGVYNSVVAGVGPAVPTVTIPFPPQAAFSDATGFRFTSGGWVSYTDPITGETVTEPPDGEIMAIIARVDNIGKPWDSIAGPQRGIRPQISSLVYSPTIDEQNAMLENDFSTQWEIVNPWVNERGIGIYLNGHNTTLRDVHPLNRVANRWTLNYIEKRLSPALSRLRFEINDDILWRQAKDIIRGVIDPIVAGRGLVGYDVTIDETTTTAEDQANNRVNADIQLEFPGFAEVWTITMTATPTGAVFGQINRVAA